MIPAPIAAFFGKWGMAMIGLALALLATFYAGRMQERSDWESRRAEQIELARATERGGVAIANTAGTEHAADLKQQLEKAHAELETLRAALPTVPDCRVPRNVVRLLDAQRVPAPAGSARNPEKPAAPVAATAGIQQSGDTVECRAVIEHCAVNRATVCEPNALQIEGLQQFYARLRAAYNKTP